jgi:hypothetical protein
MLSTVKMAAIFSFHFRVDAVQHLSRAPVKCVRISARFDVLAMAPVESAIFRV